MSGRKNKKVLFFAPVDSGRELKLALVSDHWQVDFAKSFDKAQQLMQDYPYNAALAFLDISFDTQTLQNLEKILSSDANVNWILVLPQAPQTDKHISTMMQTLVSEYCFDYHHSPVQTDRLLTILGHAYGMGVLCRNPRTIIDESCSQFGIIGESPPIKELYTQITKICSQNDPVLISGETGTGKELVANAIHYHSARSEANLMVVNCGSLTKSLVQAELFGYEKGAFTGANKRKVGRIEAANGGTLFLDEIGDLPLGQQVNLLRFLQQKTIVRVGGNAEIPVDVRIIAATHIDLEAAIANGRFREDLYFRLNVLHLSVPALRERGEDIELLARYFLHYESPHHHNNARGLSLGALHVIHNYDWPGNVRELANTIRYASIMSENRLLSPADLQLEHRHNPREFTTLKKSRSDADRTAIQACLRECNNNITQAAEQLGVSRVTLHRLIEKYRLNNTNQR